jgi:hypothetical protein
MDWKKVCCCGCGVLACCQCTIEKDPLKTWFGVKPSIAVTYSDDPPQVDPTVAKDVCEEVTTMVTTTTTPPPLGWAAVYPDIIPRQEFGPWLYGQHSTEPPTVT